MIRVLTILAVVVALAASAAPPSAGKVKHRTPPTHGTPTYGDPQEQTYLDIKLETISIMSR